MNIAILGATGHIAKNLIFNYKNNETIKLFLYARDLFAMREFLAAINYSTEVIISNFNEFPNKNYDVIINCVGLGTPDRLKKEILSIFNITEHFDNLILEYLKHHSDALYINLSSGAVYGSDFSSPVGEYSLANININDLQSEQYYGIAKLYSEARHRSMQQYNIIDLRVFGFFSRFISLQEKFLISEIINCIKNNREFVTDANDIVRDYIDSVDFSRLINLCITKRKINNVFDVYSSRHTSKLEILKYFSDNYNLKVIFDDKFTSFVATGIKSQYYSLNKRAEAIGYYPEFAAIESIARESKFII